MHLTHNFAKGMTNVFVDHIIPVAFQPTASCLDRVEFCSINISTHSLMKRLTASLDKNIFIQN